jgi:uncharacterized damage-inducible protein DinB
MAGIPDALIQQLSATHSGEPWYGTSREKLLDGVSAAQASFKPVTGGHSIWEQVLHMISWTREVTRRIQGKAPGTPAEGDWPAPRDDSDAAWSETRKQLSAAHQELLATIRKQPADRWDQPVGSTQDPALGTGVTVLGMLIGLAQHDAYHIGQIATLRRAAGLL